MNFRPVLIIWGICLLALFLSGCETVRGAAEGFTKDWEQAKVQAKKAVERGAEGIAKGWEQAKKIDDWMRENLW